MDNRLLEYYEGDEFVAGVWLGKYSIKDKKGKPTEVEPGDMHIRMAVELGRAENNAMRTVDSPTYDQLSEFCKNNKLSGSMSERRIWEYLDKYKYIIPQGSIMSILGNKTIIGSLSNCFVIPSPVDSYGGIFKSDQQIAQLEKRRGGVGLNINTLRPENVPVSNAAGTSTGAHSFMDRFSSTTREVAQNGRRGALMLLMDCRHPDIFKFVTKKADLTKVTGANISVMLTDKFMEAVKNNEDFFCTFPIDSEFRVGPTTAGILEYNKLELVSRDYKTGLIQVMKIKAKELYDEIVNMAWSNGEPGVAFIDRIHNYSPEGVYEDYKAIASNPCGEQWMGAYDACRLLALNLYNIVEGHFTKKATINYDKLYEISYIQQRLADDIVDLEIEYVERIIKKIESDPEDMSTKATELDMWKSVKGVAQASRRTGCGFTAMGDMLASLNLKYDSDEAIKVIKKVMHTKMKAELDCTIDLAIIRGHFKGWDPNKEFTLLGLFGNNEFYKMLVENFPDQVERMIKYGRRNVSWSTVAPTGTVSIVAILETYANTTAGIEPVFSPLSFRNKKVNPSDKGVRVDFTDQNGDNWQTYPIIMGGLKEYIKVNHPKAHLVGVQNLPKVVLEELFKKSPYYGSCANDIDWKKRIQIQSVVQKYTTNAISSTLNLPESFPKDQVGDIYQLAYESGLKGVTVYRDKCRTGVLTTEATARDKFKYTDSFKRPKELPADLHIVTVKGTKYAVVIGLLDEKPYEIFAYEADEKLIKAGNIKGNLVKVKKGHYNFVNGEESHTVKNIQDIAEKGEEQMLTRLLSGMLRHGAKPQFAIEQIDKCELEVVSFAKAISRTLKKYCTEEELVSRNKCSNCGSNDLRMQEGCLTCNNCGNSKCG